jgi:hypothetical protein
MLRVEIGMIFTPLIGPKYEIWAHAWEAIRALPNLRTVELRTLSQRAFVDYTSQDTMDLESITAVNPRLRFYLLILEDLDQDRDLSVIHRRTDFQVRVLYLSPLNSDTVRLALAELD